MAQLHISAIINYLHNQLMQTAYFLNKMYTLGWKDK